MTAQNYRNTFMGHVGFDQLHHFNRQSTEFGRELVNILNERAQVEQNYAKSLRRLGQHIVKATSLLLVSPLGNAWKNVGVEMEKEAEIHCDLANLLLENCVHPLSMLTEQQIKPRRMMEQQVDNTKKKWLSRREEHIKIKKRLYNLTQENEILKDQIDGPKPKTDKDLQKLLTKQNNQEKVLYQVDQDYYSSLIHVEHSRQEWEASSYDCCDAFEDMDGNRFRCLCDIIRNYGDAVYNIPSKMKSICRVIDDSTYDLAPSEEICVVRDKLKVGPYETEQLLCSYYQENFSCPMNIERRKESIKKLLQKYMADCQKEKTHHDGLCRLDEKMEGADLAVKLKQSSTMITFFEIIRYKLSCTLASLEGNRTPTHTLSNRIEHHTDRQGLMSATLKLKPGESEEKTKHSHKNKSSKSKSSKREPASSPRSSRSSSASHKPNRRSSNDRKSSTSLSSLKQNSSSSHQKHSKQGSHSNNSTSDSIIQPHEYISLSSTTEVNTLTGINQCVAIYDYDATREDELSIRQGDVISVYEKGEDGWWKGEVHGRIGLFPANYVEIEIDV